MGSQRYTQHLGATTILQTTVAAVSIFANQPLTNRAGRPFSSIVAETLPGAPLTAGVVDTLPSGQCVSLFLELVSTTYQHT